MAQENEPEAGEAPEADGERPARVAPGDRVGAVEALLFASPHPVSPARIGALLGGLEPRAIREIVAGLNRDYEASGRAFEIREVADGFRPFTRPKHHPVLLALRRADREERLTAAALETLAVIAYRQPVLRADIDAIRGVQSDAILRGLLEKGLVRIAGRADVIGRPLLYGTTPRFLEYFGVGSITDLPKPEEVPAAAPEAGAKPLPVGGAPIAPVPRGLEDDPVPEDAAAGGPSAPEAPAPPGDASPAVQ